MTHSPVHIALDLQGFIFFYLLLCSSLLASFCMMLNPRSCCFITFIALLESPRILFQVHVSICACLSLFIRFKT